MPGAVPAEAFGQAPQHKFAVALQDHVDEVDDDDPADVAEPELADDLFGGLQVVLGDRLLEVAALAGELAGVHIDDGHRLGAIDHERPARGQPHLAVEGLGKLLVDTVGVEHVGRAGLSPDPIAQVRRHHVDVVLDHRGFLVSLDDQLGEILVEDVPNHPDHEIGLTVEQRGSSGLRRLPADVLPLGRQPGDVTGELLLAGALGRGPNDHAAVLRSDLFQDRLQASAFSIRKLPADPRVLPVRHIDQIAAWQAHLAGQAGALVPHRVLGNLDDDRLA